MTDVCVLGSFMWDLAVRAPRRPGPGETVIGTAFETSLGGKGFNQAVAAARSGAATAMVGCLGDDEAGRAFKEAMALEGIDDAGVHTTPHEGTGVGLPLVAEDGQNSIVVVPRANLAIGPDDIAARRQLLEGCRVLLAQGEVPLTAVRQAAETARAGGAYVVLNPAPAVVGTDSLYPVVDCLVPNETEAAILLGGRWDGRDPDAAVLTLLGLGIPAVVLTLGASGAVVGAEGRVVEHLVPFDVACVDTVGAGDAFCGAMAARLAEGAGLLEAARYANAAGALAVTGRGASPSMPRRAEIEALLAGQPATGAPRASLAGREP